MASSNRRSPIFLPADRGPGSLRIDPSICCFAATVDWIAFQGLLFCKSSYCQEFASIYQRDKFTEYQEIKLTSDPILDYQEGMKINGRGS
ncbi:hypothetical protein OPV22_013625 [Ensete ventricosum]|uniref:Uncharacterized protein n=1 Tax=Ensete ventricosum TaxID=4639 RepID=A0AAV8PIG6_ENSVE|nr:hypothetical protein OPV22_013625 [Ensete ventricosum]